MTCHCGRDVWLYNSTTWTCSEGHHSPVAVDPKPLAAPAVSAPRREAAGVTVVKPRNWPLIGLALVEAAHIVIELLT